MQRDLGLPTVQVRLVFLADARRLRDLLVRIGYPPKLACGAEMAAIGGHRIVLINQTRVESQGWPARLAPSAGHQLGHVLQYESAGGKRGTSAQWLREGLSDWLGLRVMGDTDRAECGKAWSQALAPARVRSPDRAQVMTLGGPGSLPEWVERVPSRVRLPSLSALGSFPEWVQQLRGEAGGALYEYAFVAASTLVEERGLPAVLHYFALFAEREDPAANFLEVLLYNRSSRIACSGSCGRSRSPQPRSAGCAAYSRATAGRACSRRCCGPRCRCRDPPSRPRNQRPMTRRDKPARSSE